MSKAIYVRLDGDVVGPLDLKAFRDMAATGRITQGTRVRVGDGNWMRAEQIKQVFEKPEPAGLTQTTSVDDSPRAFATVTPPAPRPRPNPHAAGPSYSALRFCSSGLLAAGTLSGLGGMLTVAFSLSEMDGSAFVSGVVALVGCLMLLAAGGVIELLIDIAIDVRLTRIAAQRPAA